jgi:hypothetical protein
VRLRRHTCGGRRVVLRDRACQRPSCCSVRTSSPHTRCPGRRASARGGQAAGRDDHFADVIRSRFGASLVSRPACPGDPEPRGRLNLPGRTFHDCYQTDSRGGDLRHSGGARHEERRPRALLQVPILDCRARRRPIRVDPPTSETQQERSRAKRDVRAPGTGWGRPASSRSPTAAVASSPA